MNRLLIILLCCFLSLGAGSSDFEEDDLSDLYSGSASNLDMVSDTTNQTFCVWLNVEGFETGTGFGDNVMTLSPSSGDAWGTSIGDSTGNVSIIYTTGANSGAISNGATAGIWQQHCSIFEQSNDNIFMYLNGTEFHSNTSYTNNSAGTGTTIYLGESDSATNEYDGLMAYPEFFNTALTEVQLIELVYKPLSLPSASSYSLWHSSISKDLSGNGNDLTGSGIAESEDGPPIMLGGGIPL